MNYYSSEGAAGKSCYPNFNLLVVGEIYEVKIKTFIIKNPSKIHLRCPRELLNIQKMYGVDWKLNRHILIIYRVQEGFNSPRICLKILLQLASWNI